MLVVVYQEVLLKVGKNCLQEGAGFYSFNIVSGVYFLRVSVSALSSKDLCIPGILFRAS